MTTRVPRPAASSRQREEAAGMLRRLLAAVEEGDLDAPGSHGARLLRRMEGALAAWESQGGQATSQAK